MQITDKIKKLNREQLDTIVEARRATELVKWISVNSKARSACALRHRGWQEESNAYVNAIIETSVRLHLQNTLTLATLISAFESMALGIIAQKDLTLDEYELLLSPVISIFPELILLEQDWTPEPIDESLRYRPRVMYQSPVEIKEKKNRPFRRTEDLEEIVEKEVFDTNDVMAALAPKEKKPELSKDEALKAMLAQMVKKPTQQQVNEPPSLEVEKHSAPNPNPPDTRLRFIKLVTEEGGFKLKDQDTGEYFGEKFAAPIDAIIWAAKNGMKIK